MQTSLVNIWHNFSNIYSPKIHHVFKKRSWNYMFLLDFWMLSKLLKIQYCLIALKELY